MNASEARIILERLMDGINPSTGELLPDDHVCNDPQVIRALYTAVDALRVKECSAMPSSSPACKQSSRSAGSLIWTPDEDECLRTSAAAQLPVAAIARKLNRSEHSVKCRLVYLDLAPRDILGNIIAATSAQGHRGLPWYPEDDETIRRMLQQDCTLKEIARSLRRTPYGILKRLEKLGLIDSAAAFSGSKQ